MNIGIIELLHDTLPGGWADFSYGFYFRKQFAGIMPQAVAVWCRSLGHRVHYATYWGQADPLALLPDDLDIVFFSSYTQSCALAYAMSLVFRRRGTLTVLGGPHAKSFPTDSLRFFDIVVQACDRELIKDILGRRFDPPAIVSSGRVLTEFPSVEERMPEIRASVFYRGRAAWASIISLLSSIGCPYDCDFCTDWNSKYLALPTDQLHADLNYLSNHYPKTLIAYHDPNFGIRFDEVMNIIGRLPEGRRNPYVMESSLAVLKEHRLPRLRATNCVYIAPGIESWSSYSNKAGTGQRKGREKLETVIAQVQSIGRYVPGIQTNFLFGGDNDAGNEPVSLTKEFIQRNPAVWPTINMPTAFGETPLYAKLYRDNRILRQMPLSLYYCPFTAIVPKHYDTITYYDHVIELNEAITSNPMIGRRMVADTPIAVRFYHGLRVMKIRGELRYLRRIRNMLASSREFRAFHAGQAKPLPEYYATIYEQRLGRYAQILPAEARQPVLEVPADYQMLPVQRSA